MPSTKELRRRIRSVKNISQITKAMQMVAATKMRRAQNQALGGRPYSETLQKAVTELMPAINQNMNPLLRPNNSEKVAVLLLTTDKSLCGALNANVLRLAQQFCNNSSTRTSHPRPDRGSGMELSKTDSRLRENDGLGTESSSMTSLRASAKQSHTTEIDFFTLGRKGRDFVVKSGINLAADFENTDSIDYRKVKQTANILIQNFLEEKYAEVYILYPDFVSTLRQEPKLEKILPISREELLMGLNLGVLENNLENTSQTTSSSRRRGSGLDIKADSRLRGNDDANFSRKEGDFIFDTSKQQLLDFILTHFIHQKIYQAVLETKASEHSARMIAMKNATDSAKELVSDLNLAYNRTRQEGITKELLEITSALAALE